MLYLTELSLTSQAAIQATQAFDPLLSSDFDYTVKTLVMTSIHRPVTNVILLTSA